MILVWVPVIRAQSGGAPDQSQQTPQPQQPTAPEQPIGSENQTQENNSTDANTIPAIVTPDTQNPPPSGIFQPSFGVAAGHSYIQPRVDFQSAWSSNGEYSSNGSPNQSSAMQTITGGITLEQVGRSNEFLLSYQGGRTFFSNGDISDSSIQNLGLTDKWVGMRWSGTIADQASYSSDPMFGNGIGGTGGSGVNLQPVFTPGQTVLIPRTPTLNNSSAVEVDYQESLRTSLSFAATYSFLHYYGPGLINSGATNVQVGYNYRLTPRDTISGIYRFGVLNFTGGTQSIDEHIAEFSYARTLGERLKLQISGGPEFAFINVKGVPTQNYFSWTLTSNLAYQAGKRTSASATYSHGLQGGGGVFVGGSNDTLFGNVTYQFSRNWTGTASVGYSRTATISGVMTVAPVNAIDTVTVGGGIKRQLGRSASLGVTYQGYYQISSQPICGEPVCGTNLNYQSVSVVFGWHPTPIPID